jgi:hypothetical protein
VVDGSPSFTGGRGRQPLIGFDRDDLAHDLISIKTVEIEINFSYGLGKPNLYPCARQPAIDPALRLRFPKRATHRDSAI